MPGTAASPQPAPVAQLPTPREKAGLAIAAIFVLSFIQPLERLMHQWVGYIWHVDTASWGQVWRIFLICMGVLLELLVDRVDQTRSVADLVQAIALAGAITLAWLEGARRRFGAAGWGFVTGAVAGTIVTMCTWLMRGGYMFNAQLGQFQQRDFWRALDTAAGSGLFLWGLLGLAGGLAIDYLGERRVAMKVVATMAIVLILTDILLQSPNWQPNIAMLIGWGIGLLPIQASGALWLRAAAPAKVCEDWLRPRSSCRCRDAF